MVVTEEESLRRAELLYRLEQIVFAHAAVDYLFALTGLAVDILDIFRVLEAVCHVFVPCVALFGQRNVKEREGLDIRILGQTQLFETLVVLLVHEIYVVSVPLNLVLMDVVVFPHHAEEVAVGVRVAVEYVERLGEDALGVLDVYDLVAVAVNIVGTLLEQAVFEAGVAVEVGNLLAGVVAVSLGVVVAEGDRQAEEILAARYIRLVRTCARPYFLAGGDSEDLTQEGMLGLIKAVREFNGNKDASFRTFAEICIRSRLYSALRSAGREKHQVLNQSVSLDTPDFDSNSYTSGTNHLAQRDPEDDLIDREHTAALLSGVRKQLSEFEAKILGYYLNGLSCGEIAQEVGRPPKSVDNAVQRIRRKVAQQILSGEFSSR